MRLIDADALDDVVQILNEKKWDITRNNYKLIDAVLFEFPTIEPERKKGKWMPHIEKSREYIGTVLVDVRYDYWFCDACGYRVENGQPTYNYCPNCGADMRGED